MRVWITRSEPGATRLATYLGGLGFDSYPASLVGIEATAQPAPGGPFEHVIFLSEHAVSHALRQAEAVVGQAQWYAIGPATAAAIDRVKQVYPGVVGPLLTPAETTSEGLLALPSLRSVRDEAVLVVAGEGGRDALLVELRKRGARVECWCVYRRTLLQSRALEPGAQDVCIASSTMVLPALTDRWLGATGELAAPLCVPTERVARVARDLGWQRVLVSDGPTPAAVAAVLARLGVTSDTTELTPEDGRNRS